MHEPSWVIVRARLTPPHMLSIADYELSRCTRYNHLLQILSLTIVYATTAAKAPSKPKWCCQCLSRGYKDAFGLAATLSCPVVCRLFIITSRIEARLRWDRDRG